MCYIYRGKYDTYKGSTHKAANPIQNYKQRGNMILIKDRHHLDKSLACLICSNMGNMILIKDRHNRNCSS